MIVLHAATPQSAAEAEAVARNNAAPQGAATSKTTTIRDGNKTVTISTDQSGRTTITRSGGEGPLLTPPMPPMPPPTPEFGTMVGSGASHDIPPQAVDIVYGFFLMCAVMVIGWPLARAFGRRIERRGDTAALGRGDSEQLQRIEQAVEAMAIEVERISESQRFMAKLQSGSTAERV